MVALNITWAHTLWPLPHPCLFPVLIRNLCETSQLENADHNVTIR